MTARDSGRKTYSASIEENDLAASVLRKDRLERCSVVRGTVTLGAEGLDAHELADIVRLVLRTRTRHKAATFEQNRRFRDGRSGGARVVEGRVRPGVDAALQPLWNCLRPARQDDVVALVGNTVGHAGKDDVVEHEAARPRACLVG